MGREASTASTAGRLPHLTKSRGASTTTMTTVTISTDGHQLAKRFKSLLAKGKTLHKMLKPGEKPPTLLSDCLAWGAKQFLSSKIEAGFGDSSGTGQAAVPLPLQQLEWYVPGLGGVLAAPSRALAALDGAQQQLDQIVQVCRTPLAHRIHPGRLLARHLNTQGEPRV